MLTEYTLKRENEVFQDTAAVSPNNVHRHFMPAFKNVDTGEVCLSRNADGSQCTVHVLDGLPEDWVIRRDRRGHVAAVKASIIAGFVRDGCFYSREELAKESNSAGW